MDFLSHVLARTGVYVLAEFIPGTKKAPIHHYYNTVEQLEAAAQLKDAAGKTVYHACATYKESGNRKAANAGLMRSLWLDIDVDKANDANSYDDLKSAFTALGAALKALALPKPTIVSSGKGLHCYFTFTEDVSADEWKPVAVSFSNALKAVGFKQDPSRTKDAASILRPVGTHWRKDGEQIEVKLLNHGADTPFAELAEKLSKYAEAPVLEMPAYLTSMFQVSDDLGTIEYPPSSAYQVIKFCGALNEVAEKRGDVPEPYWRAMIGVVKNTVEGEDLCHEWSNGYAGYDKREAQSKIDNWTSGPTTCAHFSSLSEHCGNCKYSGKIKSPIQLGIPEAEVEKPTVVEIPSVSVTDEDVEEEQTTTTHTLPRGYTWDGYHLNVAMKDADGVIELVPFCDQLVIPTKRVRDVDGTYQLVMTRQVKGGKWKEFTIEQADITNKPALAKALGAYEVMTTGNKGDERMQQYIKSYLSVLRVNTDESITLNSLGWHESDSLFVLGNSGITAKGEVPTSIAKGTTHINEADRQPNEVSGTVQEWAALVNEMYNVKGAEAAQFVICSAFASPLIKLMGIQNWHGISIGISGTSGKGKTTVCNVALSAFGPPAAYTFSSGKEGTTDQGRIAMFSKYKDLSILHDEITSLGVESMGTLFYAGANGRSKIRLDTAGNFTAQSTLRWNLISYITCQDPIHGVLSSARQSVADATALRCFAIDTESDAGWKFVKDSAMANSLISKQYGHAGRMYMEFITKNSKAIGEKASKFVDKYAPSNMTDDERYYRMLIATVLFAAKIANTLGLISFDIVRLQKWAETHVVHMRNIREGNTVTVHDHVNELIGSLVGRVIVTKEYRDGRTEVAETSQEQLRFAPVARRVIDSKRPRLLITSKYINDWARENEVQIGWFKSELKTHGYIKPKADNTTGGAISLTGTLARLGVGTTHQTAPVRVYEFNCSKLSGEAWASQSQAGADNVVAMAKT